MKEFWSDVWDRFWPIALIVVGIMLFFLAWFFVGGLVFMWLGSYTLGMLFGLGAAGFVAAFFVAIFNVLRG